jgi:N4-gp56 family major capsid protein
MAVTNFAALTDEELTLWKRQVWRAARNQMFLNNFVGSDSNSMINKVNELRQGQKGARAVVTLVTDLTGDGVAGDRNLEGNEEPMKSYDQVIQIDLLRHAVRSEGSMADQRSIVNFRQNARNNVAYWLADRLDQMAFLTLSGVSYAFHNNGAPRIGSDLPYLDFAADVTTPSAGRHFRWDAANAQFQDPDTSAVATGDTPSWEMLVNLKAMARDKYIKPVRTGGGIDVYHVFMTPQGIARLKMDDDFLQAYRHAQQRSGKNPLFKGTPHMGGIEIDGLVIHDFRYVYNTKGIAAGSKWGGGNVDGQRVLFCGAQALGFADIGLPRWVEKEFDYDNQPGISSGKMFGFLKPRFFSIYEKSVEDFGVICVDTAI